jgi:hypothetical protein
MGQVEQEPSEHRSSTHGIAVARARFKYGKHFGLERMSQVVRDDAGVTVNHYRPEQYGSFYLCRTVLVLIAALPVEPWPTDEQSRPFQLLRQNPGL